MLMATEKRESYRGYVVVATPSKTVWGWRVETPESTRLAGQPNGGQDASEALRLAREWVDHIHGD